MAHESTTNGTLTPPTRDAQSPAPVTTSAKRKRSESDSKVLANGDGNPQSKVYSRLDVQQTLTAVVDVLKGIDTDPSILEQLLPPSSESPSSDPAPKKAKLSVPATSESVASRVKSSAYRSLEEFSKDLDTAASLVTGPLASREPAQTSNGYTPPTPLSLAETRLLTGALALQKLSKKLIDNERALYESRHTDEDETSTNGEVKEEAPAADTGVIEIKVEQDGKSAISSSAGRTVLTLFGTAQGPKQLFSSLQKPSSALGKRSASELSADVGVALPIQEELLPNMISTTKILPVDMGDTGPKKRAPTIGEIFREQANARQLTPPKTKQNTSRGTTITWEFPDAKPKRRGSSNHTTTPSSVGQWLGYRGIDATQEPSSPEAKRRLRDRALSSGEARPQLSEEARAILEQAKQDALFRSVYSSFAPSRDDAAAIVPAETKDMVWWHKTGERKFEEQFAVDAGLIDPALMEIDAAEPLQNGDYDAELKEAVENFTPDEPFTLSGSKDDTGDKDTKDILREISELLETLNSYQRIRNASLATTTHTRTPSMSSQRETMTNMAGSPTSPTSAEIDVYNLLKTQLTIMINQLPPFAVAKLNGEQLADLNISKNILFETPDYKGVMEEDQFSRLARATALSAAVGHQSAARLAQGSSANQYSPSSSNYGRSSGQVGGARSMSQNYFPQQQPPNRTPSMPIARAGQYSTPQSFQGTGGNRPSFQPQPNFNQSAMRSAGHASTPLSANQQYYGQQQKQVNYPQYYPNSPHTQSQPRNFGPQGTGAQSFQPRPPSAGPGQQAPMYGYAHSPQASSGSPNPRTASPQKMALPQNQLRTLYQGGANPNFSGTPTGATPNMQQQRGQYGGSGTPSGVGPSGFHTSMTNAEQQSLMERQRAQIQAQQQKQGGGPGGSVSPARGSATPQPGGATIGT